MKAKQIDKSTRPPLECKANFSADKFLMFLIQDVTRLPTSDILGFFADLSKAVAEEGVHYMFEKGTHSMRKEIFDFFPGTSIPYSIKVEGSKGYRYRRHDEPNPNVREAHYDTKVGFPSQTSYIDQSELVNIIVEKTLLGACEMPNFEKPDTRCPKMYRDLMAEIKNRRTV